LRARGGAVAHGGDQVARLDRLGQEVVAAFAHGVELLVQVVLGRQVDDRHADVAVVVANHLGQFGAGAGRHVHVEDDQVRLEIRQLGHGLDRFDQVRVTIPALLSRRSVCSAWARESSMISTL
jgi:hypothetical protein